MKKISVIVPIYNADKKLNKCIDSILNQTYKDIEIILVNDGSTDNSLNICKKYKSLDDRIKIIDKENEGSIQARKAGLESSEGDYIMFVDADDWVDNNIISIMYNELKRYNCDIVVSNMYKVFSDRKLIKKSNNSHYFIEEKLYVKDEIKNELVVAYFHGHPFPASLFCKLYKRSLLIDSGKYLEKINFLGEDLFLNMEVFLKAERVKIINKPLYYYRAGGGTSKFMSYHFDDIVSGYEIQKDVIDEYYKDTKQKQYNGISIMLLNSFKTSLENLMISKYPKEDILIHIKEYIKNKNIIDSIENEGSKRYFDAEYLSAIRTGDIEYLYRLGEDLYKKSRIKRIIKKILAN